MEIILDYYKFINEKESMKKGKVLFISFTDKTRGVSYHDYLKSKLDCTFCLWTDLIFQENKILIGNTDVNTFDFIFIGVVSKYPNYFVTLENYIKKYKIPYFKYGCSPERNNKILQNSLMSLEGVPQVPTVISKCSSVNSKDLIKEFKLPIVTKITNGSQGKGVEIQKTQTDLDKYLKKNKDETIIFQKFIENEGDYRLFFIGQNLLYTIRRKSKDSEKEFRNNYSLGGSVEKVELPKNVTDIAKKAAKVMEFDVSGVDLIKEKGTDNWYILEVNSAPQFGTKNGNETIIDYKEVLDKFIEIINKKIS
jgi:hypothetical protein